MSVRSPPSPCCSTGSVVHGGGASSEKIGTLATDAAPPISYSSPYGRTITSPSFARWRSPSGPATQHDPFATMWNMINRSARGSTACANSPAAAGDENDHASVNSDRKKIAPSSCSRLSACSSGRDPLMVSAGISVMVLGVPVILVRRSRRETGVCHRAGDRGDEDRRDDHPWHDRQHVAVAHERQ